MSLVGSVDLLAFGFEASGALPPKVARHLEELRGRGIIRTLDVLYVCRDTEGVLRADRVGVNTDAPSVPDQSALWQLLVSDDRDLERLSAASPEHYIASSVGLDLEAVEGLADLIQPGTSALLMMMEPKWTSDLLSVVLASGGFPIVFGYLERETLLAIGPDLAAAAADSGAAERAAAVRGAAMLDALAAVRPAVTIATDVIPALVEAHLLDDCDVDDAISTLAAAGLISRSLVAHARERADATVAEIAQIGTRRESR